MKIANKITLLVLFLLSVLAINTWLGLMQLKRVGAQLADVATRDNVLREVITDIDHRQLQKAVLFERIVRIAEEIGFGEVTSSRKEYLLSHAQFIRRGFEDLTEQSALDLMRGSNLLKSQLTGRITKHTKQHLTQMLELFNKAEQSHIAYDRIVLNLLDRVVSPEGHQMTFEDIDKIHQEEKSVTKELESLSKEVQKITQVSLTKAREYERLAQNVLWLGLFISIAVSSLIGFSIIHNISKSLKRLEGAAHQIGTGNFKVNLETEKKDEIGELSRAFEAMANKLAEFKSEVESKTKMLFENLEHSHAQKRELEKVNRELDAFVHTVSHDIAAPLMGIGWYSQYLEKNHMTKLDQKGQECLAGIRRGVDRLSRLIQDLLELTRIARIKNPYEDVAMTPLVQSVCERLEINIAAANARVEVAFDMPVIQCDRIKMREVFFNLINNAIKFSSKVQEGPVVKIGHVDRPGAHEFFVQDNGIGIPVEHQSDIFHLFKRLKAAEYEGTGAGLAIVKKVIDDHGGMVWVESEPGQGACFRFTIPKQLA